MSGVAASNKKNEMSVSQACAFMATAEGTPADKKAFLAARGVSPAVIAQAENSLPVDDVQSHPDLPTHAKLAHVFAIVVSGVIAVAVACVLADGTSVIKLKDPQFLPVATNPALRSEGLNHRLDVLLGPTYGVGLHHDQSGHSWSAMEAGSKLKDLLANLGTPAVIAALPYVISTDDLKHPVPFLSCDRLEMAGNGAMSLGFIAEIVAVVMVIFHSLVLAELIPAKIAKPFAGLVWFVLSAGFLVVCLLAVGIYTATWTCDQPVIPTIKLSDHFNYSYGFPFAIVGFLSSLLVLFVTLCVTSTKDGVEKQSAPGICGLVLKIGCGVGLLLTVGAFLAMFVAAANGAYAPQPEADPDVNPCEGKKPYHAGPGDNYFANVDCMRNNLAQTLEQAGANVTAGYRGLMDAGDRVPITGRYSDNGLCPVNVHWHLGAEHLSVGQYDSYGSGPAASNSSGYGRRLASAPYSSTANHDPWKRPAPDSGAENLRQGHQCHHYTESDPKFTTAYDWQYCTHMEIGQTYEIHWPHSAAGSCGTDWQYQTPFYDGVFCRDGIITVVPLNTYEKIGVQAQIYTVVNDGLGTSSPYHHDDLIDGMIVEGDFGRDMAKYTGSTTGTSRSDLVCSRYTPITWQVDRTCHLISASSFDKLCKDMLAKRDDMHGDVHPHGSRETAESRLVANNQQSRA
jgi:hypothetical protein